MEVSAVLFNRISGCLSIQRLRARSTCSSEGDGGSSVVAVAAAARAAFSLRDESPTLPDRSSTPGAALPALFSSKVNGVTSVGFLTVPGVFGISDHRPRSPLL